MNDRHEFQVGLEDRFVSGILSWRQTVDGVQERVQDIFNLDPLEVTLNRVLATEHFPETLAEHVMVPG